jgi:heterodisulfide reductase subunit C
MDVTSTIQPDAAFLATVQSHGGEKVSRCYQCRKCTNGCPLAFAMDVMPNQVMRMVELGLRDELLACKTIWVCASCQTCTTRCPNDIDVAHVMDTLRQLSQEAGVPPAEPNVVKFHQAVLDSIRRHGRLFELGMVAGYKLATREWVADAKLGWEMFKRGKLKFWPGSVRAKGEIRAMFDKQRKG